MDTRSRLVPHETSSVASSFSQNLSASGDGSVFSTTQKAFFLAFHCLDEGKYLCESKLIIS